MSSIRIKRSGPYSTIQDQGRFNLRHLGIPWSGCLVPDWQKIANALTNNDIGHSVIETWEGGLEILIANDSARFAICAHESIKATLHDGTQSVNLIPYRSYTAPVQSSIQIKSTGTYRHAVIAFSGLSVANHLGSTSTYANAALGGLNGSALQSGDEFKIEGAMGDTEFSCKHPVNESYDDAVLRVVLGPQEDHFSKEGIENFLSGDYVLGNDADRMGARLSGPIVHHKDTAAKDIVSDAIVPGSIQVPGTGQPIVLLRDAHTAGGYAKIATVLSIDQPKLGLQRAGTRFRFKSITIDEAIDAVRTQEKKINDTVTSLTPIVNSSLSTETLFKHNLIDGVTDGDHQYKH